MPRHVKVVTDEMFDECNVDTVEVKIAGFIGAYKVWVNTEKGCRYRAYRVGEVTIKNDTEAAIGTPENQFAGWFTSEEWSLIHRALYATHIQAAHIDKEAGEPYADLIRKLKTQLGDYSDD